MGLGKTLKIWTLQYHKLLSMVTLYIVMYKESILRTVFVCSNKQIVCNFWTFFPAAIHSIRHVFCSHIFWETFNYSIWKWWSKRKRKHLISICIEKTISNIIFKLETSLEMFPPSNDFISNPFHDVLLSEKPICLKNLRSQHKSSKCYELSDIFLWLSKYVKTLIEQCNAYLYKIELDDK